MPALKSWHWFAIAALAITILSWNRPVLSSRGGIDFYIGNNAAADGTYRPLADDPRVIAEASAGRRLDDWGTSRYFYGLGWSWMTLHPADAVKNLGRKLALVFNAGHVASEHSYPFYAYEMRTLLGFLFVGPWLLLPLGIAGLTLAAIDNRPPGYAMWVAFVPLYALSVAMYFVLERYRLPLLVPLCIGAGAVVDRVALSVRDEEFRPAVAIATVVAIVALAVATNRPTRLDDGRAEERIRMAEAMIVRDRIDAAEEWATKAAALHPRPASVHLRVARRLIVHSRPEAALMHLGQARRLEPANPDVIYAFGQALINARRPKEAIPHLREAMKAGARVDLAGYDLARALAASGDRAGALQALQAVRPANPADAQRLVRAGPARDATAISLAGGRVLQRSRRHQSRRSRRPARSAARARGAGGRAMTTDRAADGRARAARARTCARRVMRPSAPRTCRAARGPAIDPLDHARHHACRFDRTRRERHPDPGLQCARGPRPSLHAGLRHRAGNAAVPHLDDDRALSRRTRRASERALRARVGGPARRTPAERGLPHVGLRVVVRARQTVRPGPGIRGL